MSQHKPTAPGPFDTPVADALLEGAESPARDRMDLELIGRGLLHQLARLIISLIASSEKYRQEIFNIFLVDQRFITILVEQAGRTNNSAVPQEVTLGDVEIVPTYSNFRVPAGTSWLAILIGAIVGFLAGVLAMIVLDASPVVVDVAQQTATVGIAQAVDTWWFMTIFVGVTILVGACVGCLKQRMQEVRYITDIKLRLKDEVKK